MEERFKGLIQVYTGDGKGKTTAALGQALRASGQGLRVIFIQFLKSQRGGEHFASGKHKLFEVVQFGQGDLFKKSDEELLKETEEAYDLAVKAVTGGNYDVVILDEIFVAHWRGLLSLQKILDIMRSKPPTVELILTGRRAPQEAIKLADLATEMLMIKHPFMQGQQQRKGIEY
jgi:cob(I)alamin adenosyltransferase